MSPLGKYAQPVAAGVAVIVIAASVAARFFGVSDVFLDNLALMATGAVFGSAAATSQAGHVAQAAHQRLDKVGAPPSDASG